MTLTLTQSATAVGANIQASFQGVGGTAPYTYAVQMGGPGGTIDPVTGIYIAPSTASSDPTLAYDTVQVTDSLAAVATAMILVGTPLVLFCDILQTILGIANDHIYVWNQKIFQPTDSNLYLAISVPSSKPFGNVNRSVSSGGSLNSEQYVAVLDTIDIDIISRGTAARDQKESVILALNSDYSRQQQNANSFHIGQLPPNGRFINLSMIDGAAIPYRYKITVQMQYAYMLTSATEYFSTFTNPPTVYMNS